MRNEKFLYIMSFIFEAPMSSVFQTNIGGPTQVKASHVEVGSKLKDL